MKLQIIAIKLEYENEFIYSKKIKNIISQPNKLSLIQASIDFSEEFLYVDSGFSNKAKKLFKFMTLPLKEASYKMWKFLRKDWDDAFDEIIEKLAPALAKEVMEYEIEKGLRQYSKDNKLPVKKIDQSIKKELIKDIHDRVEHQITEKAFLRAGKSAKKKINPKKIIKSLYKMVKKHGWKLGSAMVVIEVTEHILIPSILIAMGFPALGVLSGSLPIGEIIIYPILFRTVFKGMKIPDEVNKAKDAGKIDWFCKNFPKERLCDEVYI